MGELEAERVGQVRVDLERVAEAELPVLKPRGVGEVLVDQLAHGHRVRRLDRVRGGQVVVLAGVDDDPGAGVHLTGEVLVDEGADRVDVAEEDPVHGVVEHHVQTLQPGEGGDLGHAQAGGVVRETHVAAELLGDLIERFAHDPEVLRRGVGPGVTLARGSLGHEVEQRLAGGADHRDHVRARPSRSLRLGHVLVDVPGRHDQVDQRRPGDRIAAQQPVPGRALAVDAPHSLAAPPAAQPTGRRRRPDRSGCASRPIRPQRPGRAPATGRPGPRSRIPRADPLRRRSARAPHTGSATPWPSPTSRATLSTRWFTQGVPSLSAPDSPASRSTARSIDTVVCAAASSSTGRQASAASVRARVTVPWSRSSLMPGGPGPSAAAGLRWVRPRPPRRSRPAGHRPGRRQPRTRSARRARWPGRPAPASPG